MLSILHTKSRRARPPVRGPEEHLIRALLRTDLPTDKRLPRVVFREPRLPTGFPDVVLAYPGAVGLEYRPERRTLTPDHVRLMQTRGSSASEGVL